LKTNDFIDTLGTYDPSPNAFMINLLTPYFRSEYKGKITKRNRKRKKGEREREKEKKRERKRVKESKGIR